jgi:glycine/D-amino acid oxidase-like deaminating enzyme
MVVASPQDTIAVIGGGMVGSAIAYGLARRGADVLLLDEGDLAYRAARGNFGLVWTQGKGDSMAAYAAWSVASSELWPEFAAAMASAAGRDIGYRRSGGLVFCLSDEEYAARDAQLRRWHNQGGASPTTMLDRAALGALIPITPLGPKVVGASLAPDDGHVNPLYLLRGLHAGLRRHGGRHAPGAAVTQIEATGSGFALTRADGTRVAARKIVIAAGVATTALAAKVGLDVPVRPQRGQIIVTERVRPLLPLPASALRQTDEGAVTIGVSNEEVGLDIGTTVPELARMAARAITVIPALASARMARSWGALRPLTPDGYPVYAQSEQHPGAFVATCHSGVTLAALHAERLAGAIYDGALPENFAPFHPRRFHVRKAA